jgi:hypothetical protein
MKKGERKKDLLMSVVHVIECTLRDRDQGDHTNKAGAHWQSVIEQGESEHLKYCATR